MSNSPSNLPPADRAPSLNEEIHNLSESNLKENLTKPEQSRTDKNLWYGGARRWIYPLIIRTGCFYIEWVGTTTKWKIQGEENVFLERCKGHSFIFTFWHSQLMMMPFCYSALSRRQKVSAMISQSRDGQIVSDFIKRFGFEPIRGSTSRGGSIALLRLSRKLREGFDLAITPDGPRGPRFRVQQGVAALASASGCPIIPVAYDVRRKKVMNTWDHFKIPIPYNSGALVIGSPIYVNPDPGPDHLELKLKEIQTALEGVNRQAEEMVRS
jgi:lysophospholipid acyltransferase (LPLAT)-like uncharacterized protein